jgi:SHS2 domain-containing protein
MDHTADLGIRVLGRTVKELFANSGYALFDLLVSRGFHGALKTKEINVTGMDWPDLMVNWLRELLYLWSDQKSVVHTITILSISPYTISASLGTYLCNDIHHVVNHDIKAVTYHSIAAQPVSGGWEATIIFDV